MKRTTSRDRCFNFKAFKDKILYGYQKDKLTNISNISEGHRSPETKDMSWYWWLNGVINTITVLGNTLVILLILTRSSLRTTQNCFVLLLAVADFLIGSVAFPLYLVYAHKLYPDNYHFKYFVYAIPEFLIYASTTNLCALTLDRYISIVHPLKHIQTMKKSNVIRTLVGTWLVAFLVAFVLLLLNLFVKNTEVLRIYVIFLLCFFDTFPCVCLPIAYFRILHFVRRQQARIRAQTNQLQHNYPMNSETERNIKNKKMMMIRVLGAVIGFFVISHLLFISSAWINYVLTTNPNPILIGISLSLLYANSAVNVFFYGIFKKDFRGDIAKLFSKRILPA